MVMWCKVSGSLEAPSSHGPFLPSCIQTTGLPGTVTRSFPCVWFAELFTSSGCWCTYFTTTKFLLFLLPPLSPEEPVSHQNLSAHSGGIFQLSKIWLNVGILALAMKYGRCFFWTSSLVLFIFQKWSARYPRLNNWSLYISHSFTEKWCALKKCLCWRELLYLVHSRNASCTPLSCHRIWKRTSRKAQDLRKLVIIASSWRFLSNWTITFASPVHKPPQLKRQCYCKNSERVAGIPRILGQHFVNSCTKRKRSWTNQVCLRAYRQITKHFTASREPDCVCSPPPSTSSSQICVRFQRGPLTMSTLSVILMDM